MTQAPTEAEIRALVGGVFRPPARLGDVQVHGWSCTFVVRTDRYQRVTLGELLEVARMLGIAPESVELWDLAPNKIEVACDLESVTPVERPVPLPPVRRGPKR